MSYTATITQEHPTALVILVDQSGSMSELTRWQGREVTRAVAVSDAINTLLEELVARCRRMDEYHHYYDIAVLGYRAGAVVPLLPVFGKLDFLMPEQLVGCALERRNKQRLRTMPDGTQRITMVPQRVWVRPFCDGNTPMKQAFLEAHRMLKEWCSHYRGQPCYPPTVINITDGEATDAGPAGLAETADTLKSLGTADGKVLLINIHIDGGKRSPVTFPVSVDELPEDRLARQLFDISSPLPPLYEEEIRLMKGEKDPVLDGTIFKGMGYNANMTDLVRMMNVGTSTTKAL